MHRIIGDAMYAYYLTLMIVTSVCSVKIIDHPLIRPHL
jgi:hypothetical protein